MIILNHTENVTFAVDIDDLTVSYYDYQLSQYESARLESKAYNTHNLILFNILFRFTLHPFFRRVEIFLDIKSTRSTYEITQHGKYEAV